MPRLAARCRGWRVTRPSVLTFAFEEDVGGRDQCGEVLARRWLVRRSSAQRPSRWLTGSSRRGAAGSFNQALFDVGALYCRSRRPSAVVARSAAVPVARAGFPEPDPAVARLGRAPTVRVCRLEPTGPRTSVAAYGPGRFARARCPPPPGADDARQGRRGRGRIARDGLAVRARRTSSWPRRQSERNDKMRALTCSGFSRVTSAGPLDHESSELAAGARGDRRSPRVRSSRRQRRGGRGPAPTAWRWWRCSAASSGWCGSGRLGAVVANGRSIRSGWRWRPLRGPRHCGS